MKFKSLQLALIFFLAFVSPYGNAQTETEELLEKGAAYAEAGKFKKALKICDQLIEKDPNYVFTYVNKSRILVEQKEYEEALRALDQGLSANSKSAYLYHQRGILVQCYGMNDKAQRDYDLGIKFSDNDTLSNAIKISKAVLKAHTRDFQGSYDILMTCFSFDSTNIATLNNLATVCDEIGKPEMTVYYLQKVIATDSLFLGGYVNLGFYYQNQGDFEKSIQLFDKALEIDPNEALSYNNRGYSKFKLGDLDGALEDVNRSIELYPGNSYAYRNRALIYIEMNKISKACEDIQLAIYWGFTEQYGNEMIQLQRKYCN